MGAVESVLREVEKVTLRPLGEVAREVEKVTLRPLGEVARGVEKVTIRPLGEVARGVEKVTIRPLGEIARELEKITIRPLGEVARGIEKVTIRPLGAIARDLEKALIRPLGGIASRTVLLMERLIHVVEHKSSMGPNLEDRQTYQETLSEIAEEVGHLREDINEAVIETPPAEANNLRFLGEIDRLAAILGDNVGQLQNNEEILQNNEEVLQINAELIEDREAARRDNQELFAENQSLKERLDFLEARILSAMTEENNSTHSDAYASDSNEGYDGRIPQANFA